MVVGKNHYPSDIELTAEQADGRLRAGCIAAFSITAEDAAKGELLVVVAEVRDKALSGNEHAEATRNLKSAVAAAHSVGVHEVNFGPSQTD